jgi:hypothetical protein
VSGQRHAPAAICPPGRTPVTHWIRGWVGLRAGLDTEATGKIRCLCRGSNAGLPVCIHTVLTKLLLQHLHFLLLKCRQINRSVF